ncbi:MAG: DUF3343 domain-containing protein [Clostridiales bacterium]|nr:DUF3343 domain-containing protein [Clostridiales bacterium]
MINRKEENIITFSNTHFAISGEKALLTAEIPVRVMGLPAQIKAGCGLCLRVGPHMLEKALKVLAEKEIMYEDCYLKTVDKGETTYRSCLQK